MGRFRGIIYLSLILALFGGCQSRRQSSSDRLDEAYKKIDQGDCQGSLRILEELKNEDPQKPRLNSALASAHAACAGFRVEQLWDFVESLRGSPISEEMIEAQPTTGDYKKSVSVYAKFLSSDLKDDVELLGEILGAFNLYRTRIEKLPFVPMEKRPHLEKGIRVLNASSTRGDRLYRATLQLVLLRSELTDIFLIWGGVQERLQGLNFEKVDDPKNQRILCATEIQFFPVWLKSQFTRVREIGADLMIAYPSKSDQYLPFDQVVQSLEEELTRLAQSLKSENCQ